MTAYLVLQIIATLFEDGGRGLGALSRLSEIIFSLRDFTL